MEWSDEAIVLSSRAHGESGVILELLTPEHGRHSGLVRGGSSRRVKPTLQPGNSLRVTWRARLEEHLGSFSCELTKARAGDLMQARATLVGLNAFAALANLAIPEREAHPSVFLGAGVLLDAMLVEEPLHWMALFVRWEVGLLEALGFGLDLSACAVTGAASRLCYVSPKSGRAVSPEGAGIYAQRLFALPLFLVDISDAQPTFKDITAGLVLTGHFLQERVLAPHRKEMPAARMRLESFARESE